MSYIRFIFPLIIFLLTSCTKDVVDVPDTPEPPTDSVTFSLGLLVTAPAFPSAGEEITLVFDPTKGNAALNGFDDDVYVHTGVITSESDQASDWKYVKADWDENLPAAKMEKLSDGKYQIKLSPKNFYGVPEAEKIEKLALVFRSADGSIVGRNKDGSDIYVPIYNKGSLQVRFVAPEIEPLFEPKPLLPAFQLNEELNIAAIASKTSKLSLFLDDEKLKEEQGNSIRSTIKFTEAGSHLIKIKASGNGELAESSFEVLVSGEVEVAELPSGADDGVTFINGGKSAIFNLYAPGKSNVYAIGEFNNWQAGSSGFMKRTPDGKRWWIQIDGLEPGKEYAYQFLVDGTLRIADPYARKILDPNNDQYIPSSVYPNLKPYPEGKTSGIVSVLQFDANPYAWTVNNFARPEKQNLVIYELLLRDFVATHSYNTLKDTLDYLENLGVNAIELMPFNEFEGNSSWGYNPSFYFAPDKYYGTADALKAFIDECHSRGIAVIMDMVLNHSFGQSPMVQLYFENGKPSSDNPWFNPTPTHPFNVGYDFNHESEATQYFVENVLKFWMEEYKVDGYRFDLSKGFTQKNSGSDVNAWSAYDASRIAIWKKYNNFIKSLSSDFYVILEHFAADAEEQELAAEGMLLWNNVNHAINEASMGWLDNADFSRAFYDEHGFSSPNLVTYMESHDEERLMFKNLQYGNASGTYSVKNLEAALKRQEMAAAFFFAVPGPKMLWQFGELGYDVSIDENGRTGEKPILWNYNNDPDRRNLYNRFSRFIHYKLNNSVFNSTTFDYELSGAVKHIILNGADNQVVVVGNFDVVATAANITFPVGGTWYDNLNNTSITLSNGTYTTSLAPGEYHIFSKSPLE